MKNVYTVREVNAYIKNMFAQDFMLNRIYVKGEVSNVKYHTSGHIYFSLKDESGTIACVMFAGQRSGLSFRMSEGQQVIVLGSIRVYERDGKYQLYAREIVLDGAGLLYEKFQALKKELEEMGMFAPEYKKPIPRYAFRVGVVTASTGAAVRDIIQISHRRNPYVQLLLCPAQVQGEGAADSIVKAIRTVDAAGVDVMIVGRGGGSMEDLWAFNEEKVARAVFDCRTPVISAVGHETDTTIIDYVADLRAPTPSAAAELAVFSLAEFQGKLLEGKAALSRAMSGKLKEQKLLLAQKKMRISRQSPRTRVLDYRQRLASLEEKLPGEMNRKLEEAARRRDALGEKLPRLMRDRLNAGRHRLEVCIQRLKGLSPLEKLNQGYAWVADEKGHAIRQTADVKPGDRLLIHVRDGRIRALAEEAEKEEYHV
ncbi:MAG TPA: exodeoxyribonuclease VII large subunit [Candidatus Bariatricus faecipullorum]|nr:exodeoxyribonuclease VII large subunit [Candidatus Bariatricus faecipullorum]